MDGHGEGAVVALSIEGEVAAALPLLGESGILENPDDLFGAKGGKLFRHAKESRGPGW